MRVLLAAGFLLASVVSAFGGQDAIFHKASAKYKVALDLARIDRVVVRSSRKQAELKIVPSKQADACVTGTMEYQIQGYHGSREDAGVGPVPPQSMVLDQERSGSTLTLRSREWIHIHHSTLYTQLTFHVPEGVRVVAEPLSYEELEETGSGGER